MYVVKADYKGRITTTLLDQIIQEGASDGTDVLQTASKTAEDTVASACGVLYNISDELTKAGTYRNFLILSWCTSIALYWIYQRIDDEDVPAKVIKNYEDAINDLEKVSRGTYRLNLPPRETNAGGGSIGDIQTDGIGLRRMGSQKKRESAI